MCAATAKSPNASQSGYYKIVARFWSRIEVESQLQVMQDVLRVSGLPADEAYSAKWAELSSDELLEQIAKAWPSLSVRMQRTFANRMTEETSRTGSLRPR